jgi:hypothetical protein
MPVLKSLSFSSLPKETNDLVRRAKFIKPCGRPVKTVRSVKRARCPPRDSQPLVTTGAGS